MKTKKSKKAILNKMVSMFIALLLVLGVSLPNTPAVHASDDNTLAVAQYTGTSGTVNGEKASNNGEYKGKWSASIPVEKVIAGLESSMKYAADKGWYPHGKDGKNSIAYVEYNVTFPEGVSIDSGNISTGNTTIMFDTKSFKHTVSGQTVAFKFPLQDENWKGVYKHYINDGGASSDKRINIEIPYTVKASSFDEAKTAETKNITASGRFETHPSGRLYALKKTVYNTDTSSKPLTSGFSASDVFTESQNKDNYDENMELDADLMLEENTGNDAITVDKDGEMDFVGVLDVKSIKEQMEKIHKKYPSEAEKVSLKDLKTGFTAKLNLPEELSFDGKKEATISGSNGVFKISDTIIDGQTLTVKCELSDAANIDTFAKLKEKINKVDDSLKIKFKTVKFNQKAKEGTDYTLNGSVNGYLTVDATNTENNNTVKFNLSWNGKQSDAGKSKVNPNTISLSVNYFEPEEKDISEKDNLDADMLVNGDTQHKSVYVAKKSDSLTMTGLLDVTPIKKKLKSLEGEYDAANVPTNIKVDDISTGFTAILTLPEELDFSDNYKVELLGSNGKFKISEARIAGKTITVKLSIANKVTTLKDIKEAVEGAGKQLRVNVKGVKFNDKAKPNTNYTCNGTISGNFRAKATNGVTGKSINFNYDWTGLQLKGGEDSTDPETKDIKLTLKYKKDGNSGETIRNNKHNNSKTHEVQNKQNPSKTPSTGDPDSVGIEWMLMIIGLATSMGAVIRRKNKNINS